MSSSRFHIEIAAVEDLAAIEALTAEAVPTAFDHPDLSDAQRAENAKLTEIVQARCLAALESPNRTVFVARDNGTVVGFVLPKRDAEALPEIVWLIVAAAYHGRDVARHLVEEALAWIGPERRVTLSVLRYNHRAIAFYRKFGFVEDGRPMDDHGLPLIRMTRPGADMNDDKIRAVTRADLPALKAVIDACALFPSDLLVDMIAGYLDARDSDEIWLTVDDGGPVAVAFCAPEQMTEGTWNLYLIAVHPERQGKGLGRALMAYLERTLAARGQRILLVETSGNDDFARTRAFYRDGGYEEEARIREFYQAGEDKVVFRKALV